MFFGQFEAAPRSDHPDGKRIAGAFVNCWIESQTAADAVAIARCEIHRMGWLVGEPENVRRVEDSDFPPEHESHAYYEQAQVDKQVFVFHTYPVD